MDPYTSNPFRVLGLRSNASSKEAGRGADRLLKWIELGEIPQVQELVPYLGLLQRDRELIKKASKEIENPRSRIKAELYWPNCELSVFDACQDFLRAGQYHAFVAHCEKSVADGLAERANHNNPNPQLDACLGTHFLAIVYHSAAIAASRGAGMPISGETLPTDWDRAFQYWALVIKNEVFWAYFAKRTLLLNDPRVDASFVQELRQELPLTLLRMNVSRAIASADRGQLDEVILNCRTIKKTQFGPAGEQALREIAFALQARFEKPLQEIQLAVSESAIRTHVPRVPQSTDGNETAYDSDKLTAYLANIEESVNTRLVPTGRSIAKAGLDHTDSANEILDNLAYAYRSISLAFYNYGGMPRASLRLTAAAKEFARGAQCKARLDEDYQTLQFLSLQKEAAELAASSRYKESLAKLEEAKQFAASDEERRTLDEWVQIAQKRIALEGVKQIDSPPTMFTFNGIGTRLYGKRNYDPHSQSYVATLYVTFIFIPILPLASYRVRDVGGGQYQFLGKVPLKLTAFIAPAIVAIVIGFLMIQDSADTNTSSPTQSVPRNAVGTITSSRPSNTEKDSLGQWIDQGQARLKEEQGELDSEATQIDSEHHVLNQKANELNAGSSSQEAIDSYEADRERFNRRVQAYNSRLEKHHADITSCNAQVNRYNSMP